MRRVDHLTTAELVIRGGTIHAFDGAGSRWGSLAARDGKVVAVDALPDGLDPLIGPTTTVVDGDGLTVLPGFFDSHNHLLHTALDVDAPDLSRCRDLDALLGLVASAADDAPDGSWIVPSKAWHETNLVEGRLPTAAELDRAAPDHPVALRRGGHVMVANSAALHLAGIDETTPDPDGGTIERDEGGHPTGRLIERPAFGPVAAMLPGIEGAAWADALRRTAQDYASRGITSVRDPGLYPGELLVYQDAHDRGWLPVRVDAMVRLDPATKMEGMVAELGRWDARTGLGDDRLRLAGIKLFADGGIEGAAMSADYANQPGYRGHLLLSVDELVDLATRAVERGWRVGCHAVGDRAVAAVVEGFARVQERFDGLPAGWLTLEHGFLADEELRRRVVDLGIGVTVQHPLAWFLGGNMRQYWGDARAAASFPVADWVAEGAIIAAGSDSNIAPVDPMLSVWGLCTRGTASAGVLGPDQVVDRATAFALTTVAGARVAGDDTRGPLLPGRLADLAAYDVDPLTCDVDDLPGRRPLLTLLGGSPTYDPERLAAG